MGTMRPRLFVFAALGLVAITAAPRPADASVSVALSLDDLMDRAQRVVLGHALGSVSRWEGDEIITEITVDKDTNDVTFSFQAKIGETYIIERSTSLKPINEPGGWLELEDSLIAESETETYTDPGAAADGERFFYRVRAPE